MALNAISEVGARVIDSEQEEMDMDAQNTHVNEGADKGQDTEGEDRNNQDDEENDERYESLVKYVEAEEE